MEVPSEETLARMPLAEGVLLLWRWITGEERLQTIWDRFRGRCYDKVISFTVMVHLIADALIQYRGSGRRSFEKNIQNETLTASVQAAYGKLGRLPLPVSQAFLAEGTKTLQAVFPVACQRQLPTSLQAFRLLTLDGKALKRVAKRLLKLRGVPGGLLGGRALVAMDWCTGLVVAMQADPDGDANEVRLVAPLLPQVRAAVAGPRLWLADRAFCDLDQATRFSQDGDHFLVRYHPKVSFHPDPARPARQGVDERGRPFVEDWGWLGTAKDKRRRYVRRITLPLAKGVLCLLSDLLDAELYPAVHLLALYAQRAGIEFMFQEVTEVFGLAGLIGGTPNACIFQFAFCLLLYNLIATVRGYVSQGQKCAVADISSEKLFDDIQRQLTAWYVMVDIEATLVYFQNMPTANQMKTRLKALLGTAWDDTWAKAPPQKIHRTTPTRRVRTHNSVFRLLKPFTRRRRTRAGIKVDLR
jgi:DDE family transposase